MYHHTFEPPHLWALSPTWSTTPSPTVAESISPPGDVGQNFQVADKCIDNIFTINITTQAYHPFLIPEELYKQ